MDKKNIIIIVLLIILGVSLYFRVDDTGVYKDKIEKLKIENKLLQSKNDSIDMSNEILEKQIVLINDTLKIKDSILVITEHKIKKLQNKRNEIPNTVNVMDGDDVAESFTNYLQRRGKDNN